MTRAVVYVSKLQTRWNKVSNNQSLSHKQHYTKFTPRIDYTFLNSYDNQGLAAAIKTLERHPCLSKKKNNPGYLPLFVFVFIYFFRSCDFWQYLSSYREFWFWSLVVPVAGWLVWFRQTTFLTELVSIYSPLYLYSINFVPNWESAYFYGLYIYILSSQNDFLFESLSDLSSPTLFIVSVFVKFVCSFFEFFV